MSERQTADRVRERQAAQTTERVREKQETE